MGTPRARLIPGPRLIAVKRLGHGVGYADGRCSRLARPHLTRGSQDRLYGPRFETASIFLRSREWPGASYPLRAAAQRPGSHRSQHRPASSLQTRAIPQSMGNTPPSEAVSRRTGPGAEVSSTGLSLNPVPICRPRQKTLQRSRKKMFGACRQDHRVPGETAQEILHSDCMHTLTGPPLRHVPHREHRCISSTRRRHPVVPPPSRSPC